MTALLRSFMCTLMLATLMLPLEAEAKKRFGGGGSFGKSFTTQKRVDSAPKPAATQQSTTQQKAAQTSSPTAAAKPRSGMAGLMGGLLAGGLLGALFFGGAFDGLQLMDIVIIGLILFVVFKLLKRSAPAPRPVAYAGNGGYTPPPSTAQQPPEAAPAPSFEPTPLMSSRFDDSDVVLPSWFERDAFIEGARQHFAELQRAWSANDLETIRTYCSAELFQQLSTERTQLGNESLDNDLVSVMADIVGYGEEGSEAHLSINFYGWMREGAANEATEFNEIWHLTRDLEAEKADWFIVGIEQP